MSIEWMDVFQSRVVKGMRVEESGLALNARCARLRWKPWCVDFNISPDTPGWQEVSEVPFTDLQSHPFPGGPAAGWWSSLHGPTPAETQSHPGRSPSLAASPSVSVDAKEQHLSIFILHASPSTTLPRPLLSLWSWVISFVLYPFLLFTSCGEKWGEQIEGEETRVPGPVLPCPDLWDHGRGTLTLWSVYLWKWR